MKHLLAVCPICNKNSVMTHYNSSDAWSYFSNTYGGKTIILKYCNNCGSILTILDEENNTGESLFFDENQLLWSVNYLKFKRLEEFNDSNIDKIIELAEKESPRLKDNIIYITFLKGKIYSRAKKFDCAIENFEKTLKLIELLNVAEDDFGGPWNGCMDLKDIFENLESCYKNTENLAMSDFYAKKVKEYNNNNNHYDPYEEKRMRDAWHYPNVSAEEMGLVWNSDSGEWEREDD